MDIESRLVNVESKAKVHDDKLELHDQNLGEQFIKIDNHEDDLVALEDQIKEVKKETEKLVESNTKSLREQIFKGRGKVEKAAEAHSAALDKKMDAHQESMLQAIKEGIIP